MIDGAVGHAKSESTEAGEEPAKTPETGSSRILQRLDTNEEADRGESPLFNTKDHPSHQQRTEGSAVLALFQAEQSGRPEASLTIDELPVNMLRLNT